MTSGRHSRKDRLTELRVGAWITSSQDYATLAYLLYLSSAKQASAHSRGNASLYTYAGVPLLFSALRAFLVECNSGVYGVESDASALSRLASDPNELELLRSKYGLNDELLKRVSLLYEARNEVIHPAHLPSGTGDSTPNYIRPLKELGVLETTGDPKSDYPWMFQLQSHRLFKLAFSVVEEVVAIVVEKHSSDDPIFQCPNRSTFSRYRQS